MSKLYPPSIAGTLPSFYRAVDGITNLVIPFSMNKVVSTNEVKNFSLRFKTTNTDILYGVLTTDLQADATAWNKNERSGTSVTFTVPDTLLNKLIVGQFYKIQLAYIDQTDTIGYYSTVGIIKYTAKPSVEISKMFVSTVNNNIPEYMGVYRCQDVSEKAYEYKFDLYDMKDHVIETSGWKLHNSYEDATLKESVDRYILRYALQENVTYKIQYSVKTNNNLIVESVKYLIMEAETIDPEIRASLKATLNYDNACIDLRLVGELTPGGSEYAITGKFILSRASSLDNFSSWLTISKFTLTGELPSAFLFKDFTIESGASYIYSLQQYNDFDLYSNRMVTDKIYARFEDVFLFDGKRQLKIRFNPKIASFKTVLLESKKNTIGSKYPFIFKNGSVAYKEFPISGLISYMMDNEEFFLSKKDDLFVNYVPNDTNLTDENITLERLFKLEVLNWLNNGEIKLFKSPQEGNYIVRLMNVSLSPVDQVGRMLHNFSCQASEIADFSSDNLQKYNFINSEKIDNYQMRWQTVVLDDLYKKYDTNEIYGMDLLNGYKTYYIHFMDVLPGTIFQFTDSKNNVKKFIIGVTGAYEINFDQPVGNLQLISGFEQSTRTDHNMTYHSRAIQGSLTYSIMSARQNQFNTIESIDTVDVLAHQVFGPNENILAPYQNLKRKLSKIHYIKFTKLPVQIVSSPLFGIKDKNGIIISGDIVDLKTSKDQKLNLYTIQKIDSKGKIDNTYYYIQEIEEKDPETNKLKNVKYQFVTLSHYDTVFLENANSIEVLNEYTVYRLTKWDESYIYYRLNGDKLMTADKLSDLGINISEDSPSPSTYSMVNNDLNQQTIYLKNSYDDNGKFTSVYYKFNGVSLEQLQEYSTNIVCKNARKFYGYSGPSYPVTSTNNQPWIVGDLNIDINDSEVYYISDFDLLPESILIGSGVMVEMGMQLKYITYDIEKQCEKEKNQYDTALKVYHCAALHLKPLTDDDPEPSAYYIWEKEGFHSIPLQRIEDENYTNDQLYIPTTLNSPAVIQEAYKNFQTAEKNLIDALTIILEKQEEIMYE